MFIVLLFASFESPEFYNMASKGQLIESREQCCVQILGEVANNPYRNWIVEVEKGFVWTVVEHESDGSNPKLKYGKDTGAVSKRRKGNLLEFKFLDQSLSSDRPG